VPTAILLKQLELLECPVVVPTDAGFVAIDAVECVDVLEEGDGAATTIGGQIEFVIHLVQGFAGLPGEDELLSAAVTAETPEEIADFNE
jgi:hypothetical protein